MKIKFWVKTHVDDLNMGTQLCRADENCSRKSTKYLCSAMVDKNLLAEAADKEERLHVSSDSGTSLTEEEKNFQSVEITTAIEKFKNQLNRNSYYSWSFS